MESDRNLLFGVLALQADVLTRGQFIEACTAWAARKDVALADLLVERGWISAEDRADVERLSERKLKKHLGDVRASLAEATTDDVRQSLSGVDDPALQLLATLPAPPRSPVPTVDDAPEAWGRYALTRLHARGGIGQVWLARDCSLGRDVALKELRPERLGEAHLCARFLKEAQITGQLEHPGIVPIYELARKPGGDEPFYTMRFVRGRTLTQALRAYHDRRWQGDCAALEFRELLAAFVGVCNAVAYAHSRGVIHRDLKPQNVVLGDFGEVMVLDWGLAKVTGDGPRAAADEEPIPPAAAPLRIDPAEGPHGTQQGQVLGTPAYMAPEQADGRLDLIDTRTDVYGLGAVLYEVLTGQAPFAGADSREILKKVRHELPQPPKALVPGTPPALEAICLKALTKEAARRYASAKELSQDLGHYLADEPTTAYREPLTARLGRWGRRHRTLATAAAALLVTAVVALAVGTVLLNEAKSQTAAQRDRAREAEAEARDAAEKARAAEAKSKKSAAQAEAVNNFLITDLLGQANPENNPVGARITVRELLDKAAKKVPESAAVADQPEVEAALRFALGRTYYGLGLYPEAEQHLRRALDLRRRLLGADDPHTLNVLNNLAVSLWYQNKLAEAESAFREIIEIQRTRDPDSKEKLTREATNNLGLVLRRRGQFAEAEQIHRRLLEAARRDYGPEHTATLNSMNNLANVLVDQGKNKEAELLLREQLAVRRRVQGENNPTTATAMTNLALVLFNLGQREEAEELLTQAIARRKQILGPEHPVTADTMRRLGEVQHRRGKLAEAEAQFRQALEILRKKLPADHPDLADCLVGLGEVLLDRDQAAAAEPPLREALAVRRKVLAPRHPQIAESESALGACLSAEGHYAEAEPLLLAAHDHLRAAVPPGDTAATVNRLVKLYEAWGNPEKAAEWRAKVPAKPEAEGRP